MRSAPTSPPPGDTRPPEAPAPTPEHEAIAAQDDKPAKAKGSRPVIRYFRVCLAGILNGATRDEIAKAGKRGATATAEVCTYETNRWPSARRAEIELQDHALTKHSEARQKRVVVERREVDV